MQGNNSKNIKAVNNPQKFNFWISDKKRNIY